VVRYYAKQCNRIEDPEIKPHSYSHLIFDKEAKNIHWRKAASSTSTAGKMVIYMQRTETRLLFLTLYKKQFQMDERS
jgi:hypothetical protein